MKIISNFLKEKTNDFKVGDIILTGKWKNRSSIVKGFGKDKNNQPTVKTDKGEFPLYRFRVKKLMKEQLVQEIKVGNIDMSRYEKMYDKFDKGHDRNHMLAVFNLSIPLAKKYLPTKVDLVKITAILHDIGLVKGRKNHEENGYRMILHDDYLKTLLNEREISLIADAVRQHRASTGKPKTILAKIISDADRGSGNTKEAIKRSYNYQKHIYPTISNEEALKLAFKHLLKKYAKNGYGRRCYFPETKKRLAEIYDPICDLAEKNDLESFKKLLENKISLPKVWTDKLSEMSETGMGYQKATLVFNDGKTISNVVINNGQYLEISEDVDLNKLKNIIIQEQKSVKIVPWNGFIYHYLFNDDQLNKILKSGKILSADRVLNEKSILDYAKRAIDKKFPNASKKNTDLENAKIYWKRIYEERYEPITKKPYLNYGIYLTPLDLFQFDNNLKYRFRFNIFDLLKQSTSIVMQIGAKRWLVKSEISIEKVMDYFQDYIKVEKLWNSSKLKFQRLPQIVIFTDSLSVDKYKLEIRTNN